MSSTRSAIGWIASWRSPSAILRAVPATFAEFRSAYAPRTLMRILHVTPHLPPDQAANALLPWQLGNWAHAGGEQIEYVAHPPRAGGTRTAGRTGHLGAAQQRRPCSRAA